MEAAKHIKLMANIILTTDCQRECSYCFAKEDRKKHVSFTIDSFKTAAKFIATGSKSINLLGGEPTLHKDFILMLEYLIAEDFMIQVFTNGMVSKETSRKITNLLNGIALRENQLFFAININEEKYRTAEEIELQTNFLKAFGKLVYPSFTIHDENTNLLFLIDLINKYDLDPTIRLGLAMPIASKSNKYLLPEHYTAVASSIKDLSENSSDIKITLDCGFPLCMFTLDEIAELSQNKNNDFAFICGHPLDIYPDLTVTNCFPLAHKYRDKITNFSDINQLYKFLEDGFTAPIGIHGDMCRECSFFKKACSGGCKGFLGFIDNDTKET